MDVTTLVDIKCMFVCDCNCVPCVTDNLSKIVLGPVSLPTTSVGEGLCCRPGVALIDVYSL